MGRKEENPSSARAAHWYAVMGRNLRSIRADMGLEQKDVAARAGIGLSTYQRMEQGKPVQFSKVIDLCVALDISPAQLFIEKIPYETMRDAMKSVCKETLREMGIIPKS